VKHRFSEIPRIPHVAKSDLGTKRICPTTGKKFYDLNKTPVISPYTGEVVPIAPIPPPRTRADAAARAAAASAARPQKHGARRAEEFVPLEEADAEENTGKSRPSFPIGDDIEVDETIEDDDDDDRPSSPTTGATRTSPTSSATSATTKRLEIAPNCVQVFPGRQGTRSKEP
jgi:uncharacterized protein (TIGR02300 family)